MLKFPSSITAVLSGSLDCTETALDTKMWTRWWCVAVVMW